MNMRHHSRLGFSMPELLMVVLIIGVTAALAAPRFMRMRQQSDLDAAARVVSSYMYRARAAAIGRGRTVRLATSGNAIWVIIPATGDTIGSRQDLATDRQVTMVATVATIDYSPRGIATGLSSASPPQFTLSRGGMTKVICTTSLGMVRPSC
jgi:prepilin-type N-terminal cleavage/methylation domain-containing protein